MGIVDAKERRWFSVKRPCRYFEIKKNSLYLHVNWKVGTIFHSHHQNLNVVKRYATQSRVYEQCALSRSGSGCFVQQHGFYAVGEHRCSPGLCRHENFSLSRYVEDKSYKLACAALDKGFKELKL